MTSLLLHRQYAFGRYGWALIAILLGLMVATQSLPVIAVMVTIVAFLLLSAFTPFAALAFVLVLSPLRTLIATEASFQLPLDIGQIALIGFMGAWLLHYVIIKQSLPYLAWSPLYLPLILFILVTGLTAFTAVSLSSWLSEWLKWLQITLITLLMLTLASGKKWQWLIAVLIVAGCANAIIGLYEFFGGSGALHLLINNRFFRAFGTFGQPNPFGGFMGLLTPLALGAVLGYGLRWWQNHKRKDGIIVILYGVSACLLVTGIVISWSRGAWLASVVAIAAMVFAIPRRTRNGLLLAASLGSILAILWFGNLLPQSIVNRISSSTEDFFAFEDMRGVDITAENYPVVERLAHWQAALNMAVDHPWLGVGFGNYEVAYPQYRLLNWDEPLGHAHNYYLNILAEVGFLGLLAYGNVWAVIIWITWRARKHPDILSRFVIIGLLGSWAYLLVHSLFDNLYVNNLFLHLGVMFGILGIFNNQVSNDVRLRIL